MKVSRCNPHLPGLDESSVDALKNLMPGIGAKTLREDLREKWRHMLNNEDRNG
jgi:hypothetical protein